MRVEVSATVNPTESVERVSQALESIFPAVEFKESGRRIVGENNDRNSLADFKELLKNQKIRDSARAFLLRATEKNKMVFQLNKQVAYVGKISFLDFEVALGAIEVSIEDDKLENLVGWLCE